MSKLRYVAVSGTIAAGKTTLAKALAERTGWTPFLEEPDLNPYLAKYYDDPAAWALRSQMWFLVRKCRILEEIARLGEPAILDRTIYEDRLIASTVLPGNDYELYRQSYILSQQSIVEPSLIVFLRVAPELSLSRIRSRGKAYERHLSANMLARLNTAHEKWITKWRRCPVVLLQSADFSIEQDVERKLLPEIAKYIAVEQVP